MLEAVVDWLRGSVPFGLKAYYWAALPIYANPWTYGLIGVILALEWRWPARPRQAVLSKAFVQDFIWFNLDFAVKVALLPAFVAFVAAAFDGATGRFRVVLPPALVPFGPALGFLAFDFVQWLHHWIRHKVRPLWYFHAIHHSQREMNVFTDLRNHAGEYVFTKSLETISMLVFGFRPMSIVGVSALTLWQSRFIHANVRTNLGPLGWLIVGPQFHRVHHSIEPRHRDCNFGVIFTIWDRLFGTFYPARDEYPATGVQDVDFPPPDGFAVRAWVASFAAQFAYPFRMLWTGDRPAGPR